jgi:hypothetical protein
MQASKAAVREASQQSSDMIGKLATDSEAAATRAQTKIAEANRSVGATTNASMRKAADAANKSVEATREAVRKTREAAAISIRSNVAAVKLAAAGARASLIRAANAASSAARAANAAARTTWERDMAQSQVKG